MHVRRALSGLWLAAATTSCASAGAPRPQVATPERVGRGCPPERGDNGEVRLVFLGDSGYGTGAAEWGTHAQDAVAAQINRLALEPDLVFFLGDNVYWRGNEDLYKPRFDDIYDPLIRECRAHVALGNHDVKGCRAVSEYEQWESCFQELRGAVAADLKARYQRQGMAEAEAAEKAETEAEAELGGALEAQALASSKGNCLPGDATAYESEAAGSCHAEAALAHAQFGFGSVEKGDPPASQRQRYYSILYPLPRTTRAGTPRDAGPQTRPLVDVIVLDSNTLHVGGSVLGKSETPREDRLQLLWLRSAMAQWLPAPGETHRIWKLLTMHHSPRTPRGCACRVFGKCIGGHGDQHALDQQLQQALQGLEPPDMILAGHNHLYARSHPLDPKGNPVKEGQGAVRYFVTGGGGAPLYAVHGQDPRWARTESIHHFVYMRLTAASAFYWTIDASGRVRDSGCFEKGSNVDRPLAPDFRYDDALPPRCAVDGSQPAVSPRTTPEAAPAPPGQAAGAPERWERQ